jgi:hypothetical protein
MPPATTPLLGRLRFLLAWFLVGGAAASAQTAPEHMKLFLLIGQSNMAGRGVVGPDDRVTNPRIFMLTRELSWKLATDPVHFDKPIAGVGLCSEFARVLVKSDPTIVIGLIPCAVGGTSLDEWRPGGALYVNAVARAREAMKRGTLAGILWHQGEADIAHERVATYADRFASMIALLRSDLGAEKVPLVIGEIGHFRRENTEFNAVIPSVARGVALCAYVTTENLKDRGDRLHFDTPSLYVLGQRYATAYMALAVDNPSGGAVPSP